MQDNLTVHLTDTNELKPLEPTQTVAEALNVHKYNVAAIIAATVADLQKENERFKELAGGDVSLTYKVTCSRGHFISINAITSEIKEYIPEDVELAFRA